MTTEVLTCEAVEKKYGGVTALRRIDLGVNEGEIVGLIGANGAGKSTLIDIIAGATQPTGGKVSLRGKVLSGGPSQRAAEGVSRTFQMPQVAMELTLEENILCGLSSSTMSSAMGVFGKAILGLVGVQQGADDARRVAADLGLEGLGRKASAVSFGELRLVEVARALVQKPALVMLDEPFPGVDKRGIEGVISALLHLKQSGHGVLLVDHNVDVVASVVDRIILIADGEVAVEGPVDRCLADPTFRRRYIGVT